jgi:hypothetical protein
MRHPYVFGFCLVAVAALHLSSAQAAVRTLAEAGPWSATGGTTDSGKPLCGVSSSGGGKWFGLKYFKGDSGFTVQLSNEAWTLKDGLKAKIAIQFDRESPWTATGEGFHMSDGDAAFEFEVPNKQLDPFLNEFAAAKLMVIRFPDQKALSDWRFDMSGTSAVSAQLISCIRKMNGT